MQGGQDSRGSSGGEELWGQRPSPGGCEDGLGYFKESTWLKPGAGREAAGGKNWKALAPRRRPVQSPGRGVGLGSGVIDSQLGSRRVVLRLN